MTFFSDLCGRVDTIVTHSYASTLLLEYLSDQNAPKSQPKHITLISPFYKDKESDFRWASIDRFLNGFQDVLASGISASSKRPISSSLSWEMARIVQEQIGPYGWMEFYATYLRTPKLTFKNLRSTVVIVHGAQDLAAQSSDSRALHKAIRGSELKILEAAGHYPMKDAPRTVFDAIKR